MCLQAKIYASSNVNYAVPCNYAALCNSGKSGYATIPLGAALADTMRYIKVYFSGSVDRIGRYACLLASHSALSRWLDVLYNKLELTSTGKQSG